MSTQTIRYRDGLGSVCPCAIFFPIASPTCDVVDGAYAEPREGRWVSRTSVLSHATILVCPTLRSCKLTLPYGYYTGNLPIFPSHPSVSAILSCRFCVSNLVVLVSAATSWGAASWLSTTTWHLTARYYEGAKLLEFVLDGWYDYARWARRSSSFSPWAISLRSIS